MSCNILREIREFPPIVQFKRGGMAWASSNSFEITLKGPSWGHGVSHDLVRWTHLPVALWNGEAGYDIHALFAGSATVAPKTATPVLVFPGVCDLSRPPATCPAASTATRSARRPLPTRPTRSSPNGPSPRTPSSTLHCLGHCGWRAALDCQLRRWDRRRLRA